MNTNSEPQKPTTIASPSETLMVLALASLVFYYLFSYKWLIYLAIALLIIGLFIKPIAKIIHLLWFKLAILLGNVNSKILLSIIFFIVLTPIALLYRIFNKDTLQIKRKSADNVSYYTDRNHTYKADDLKNIW